MFQVYRCCVTHITAFYFSVQLHMIVTNPKLMCTIMTTHILYLSEVYVVWIKNWSSCFCLLPRGESVLCALQPPVSASPQSTLRVLLRKKWAVIVIRSYNKVNFCQCYLKSSWLLISSECFVEIWKIPPARHSNGKQNIQFQNKIGWA